MVTKTVKYKGFDGEDIEEKIYLRLTKAEFMKLDQKYEPYGGFVPYFRKLLNEMMLNAKSRKGEDIDFTIAKPLVEFLDTLILSAYGEKEEDGRFVKKRYGQPLKDEFESSQAYSELLMHLLTDEGLEEIEPLILGILPMEDVDMSVVNEKRAEIEARRAQMEDRIRKEFGKE